MRYCKETYKKILNLDLFLVLVLGVKQNVSEAYSELFQRLRWSDLRKLLTLKAVNCPRKTLHLRCLTGF